MICWRTSEALHMNPTQDDLKRLAAEEAVSYVESGMVLGLGTVIVTIVVGLLSSRDVMRRAPLAVMREITE